MLVITRTWLDASLAIDNRILGPLQTVLYLLIASILYWSVCSRVHAIRPRLWAAGTVAVAALVVWLPNIASLSSELTLVAATTPIDPGIRALPPSQFIVTNDSAGMYLQNGRASMLLPFQFFYTTGQSNSDFNRDVGEVGQLVRRNRGVVVWSPTITPGTPSPEQLVQLAGLVITQHLAKGVLILAAPGQ
jgi:hypothetical protein